MIWCERVLFVNLVVLFEFRGCKICVCNTVG